MRVALLAYGTGNLQTLTSVLEAAGAEVRVEADANAALSADALVLPAAGMFGTAMTRLGSSATALRSALYGGLPCLGIGVGMLLLFESSDDAAGAGIGAIPGAARKLAARRVPHMGWNTVEPVAEHAAAQTAFPDAAPSLAYFANSSIAEPSDPADVAAWTEYDGRRFPAVVRRHNAWGVQYRPEKSGAAGRGFLERWLRAARTP